MSMHQSAASTRTAERFILSVIAVNALLTLALGAAQGRWAWPLAALGLAAGITLLCQITKVSAVWCRFAYAAALAVLVAAEFRLVSDTNNIIPNLFVTLSLVQVFRDWRVQIWTTLLLVAQQASQGLMTWGGVGLPVLYFLVALCAFTVLSTRRAAIEADERFELEFLVNAMGRDGPVRLNLDVVVARSAMANRLKDAQSRMVVALREVRDVIFSMHAAAGEMNASSEELMQRTNSTATGLRDAAMSLEQINVIVQESSRASKEAREMAVAASTMAQKGGEVVSQVVQAMTDIGQSSHRITDIIGVIDAIAFQTNILALNAAVEAARAGESGRGFAVVAGEVRMLARRSAEAAQEIKSLIGESVHSVARGTGLASEAGRAMVELVSSVQRVGAVFDSLTADSSEHAQGIDVVTASVRELDDVTRENTVTAERSGDVALELQGQTVKLADVLGAFRLGDDDAVVELRNSAQAALDETARRREAGGRSNQGSRGAGDAPTTVEFF